jgi:hypothetical protein
MGCKIVVTAVDIEPALDGSYGEPEQQLITEIHLFEFDTLGHVQQAIAGLATAHGCRSTERLDA